MSPQVPVTGLGCWYTTFLVGTGGKQLAMEAINSLVLITGGQSFSGNTTKVSGSGYPGLGKVYRRKGHVA